MSFNKAQSMAISHKEGPLMVLAGPGSGKTLVITKRIEYLINNYKVRPEEILVITFTKAATKEMKERFEKLENKKGLPITFGTFHKVYYGILKWAYRLNASNILSEDEKFRLLNEVMNQIEIDMEIEDEKEFLQGIVSEISNIKNNKDDLNTYESLHCSNEIFREIFVNYEKKRKSLKKIDFDDMLVLCYELFTTRNDVLLKWQNKFKYILIDEFQDINRVQYEVIKMLAAPTNNLFVVGDDDQSIYQFRGAKPELMLGFKKDYPNAKEIILDINYRSTKSIVTGANRIIRKNSMRFNKEIITWNEQGQDIHIQELKDPIEESEYVIKKILELRKRGVLASEIAILFRTNIEARVMAESLMEYNVPFQIKEQLPNIYEHFIGENIKSYLRMAKGGRARADFLNIMNRPKRYISRSSLEKQKPEFEDLRCFYCDKSWMQDRIDQWELDLRIMKEMAPFAAINYLRKRVGYGDFLKEYASERSINIQELEGILEEIQNRAKAFKTMEQWFDHIDQFTMELKKQKRQMEDNPDAITLLTLHGAKGLEFKAVFIIGVNEDIIPYKKAKLPGEVEEERRMFYVGMTRAKEYLTISYTKEKNGKELIPSRFVENLLFIV